jgi:hypothetical protein
MKPNGSARAAHNTRNSMAMRFKRKSIASMLCYPLHLIMNFHYVRTGRPTRKEFFSEEKNQKTFILAARLVLL